MSKAFKCDNCQNCFPGEPPAGAVLRPVSSSLQNLHMPMNGILRVIVDTRDDWAACQDCIRKEFTNVTVEFLPEEEKP